MLKSFSKVMIFGRPGSGKSTFAYSLHKLTNIPLYHLDKIFFTSYWVERNYQEFITMQQSIVDKEAWIIDGNSSKSLEVRYSKAELVLYFNYSRWTCYWRIVKRFFKKDKAIDDRAENCKEVVRFRFLQYVWNYEKRVINSIHFLRKKYPNVLFIEINSDRDLKKVDFLAQGLEST